MEKKIQEIKEYIRKSRIEKKAFHLVSKIQTLIEKVDELEKEIKERENE